MEVHEPIRAGWCTGRIVGMSPDLFPLEVDGNPNEIKWVLVVSATCGSGVVGDVGVEYFTGQFNGREFIVDESSGKQAN